jgi:hypothetical protein
MDEETSYEFSDSGHDKDMCSMQNVAGEILGAQRAITEAIALGLKEINVYYDYQGIESWADGSWKRNKKGTVQYYEFVQEAKKLIGINFYKVKGSVLVGKNTVRPSNLKIWATLFYKFSWEKLEGFVLQFILTQIYENRRVLCRS